MYPDQCHGAENVVKAALRTGVKGLVALSTDKAVNPINIHGERYTWVFDASQAIPMLVKKIMSGDDPVVICGSGEQRRNYLHAKDCADAMVGLLESDFSGVVNIGTEETVTLRERAEAICQVAGRAPRLVMDTSRPAYPRFAPKIDLIDGLQRMATWYRSTFADMR
jgi:nucleoside-diphosphate-sugar epimerase